MATIVLSAVGAAIGSSIGGAVMGLSSVVIGRAVGAIIGRSIDNRLMGAGSEPVETGKLDRLRITGVSEGAPIPQVFGRFRTGGQVIWASKIKEHKTLTNGDETGSGKGFLAPKGPTTEEYSYSVTLAIGLCEGEISHVGRIWADGKSVKPKNVTMRVYPGDETQLPDPALEAALGAGNVPAYRGTAYVVLEDFDLTAYNNRIPTLNFEVFRPEQPGQAEDTATGTRAVAMIPGCGEYALATETVHFGGSPGRNKPANKHSPLGLSDFEASMRMLEGELPNCESVSLIVSWFGDDLRADQCQLRPKIDQAEEDATEMPWIVSGLARADADLVPYDDDARAVYGGTPTDQSVKQALQRIQDGGKAATFYPFILMEQMPGNGLTDPWTGAGEQPSLPWRGRITTSMAPGQTGSPDGTAAAEAEVDAFFGQAQALHFIATQDTVSYIGPSEWSYRRFILHYAHLCAQVGGVEAFLIGSELRALTQVRGANGLFPVVDKLKELAADVRLILGPGVKVSYAADWSEYFGYQPQDSSGDVLFHLDQLWSDPNIDFIGIDNYMPLSDWRDGDDHADAHWGSIYNLDYLKANVMGGEGYDWYYHAPEAREVQLRTPITDGAEGEPWVYRYKDIKSWWSNVHHDRVAGVRSETPTDWVPGSKPIWFTELGCAAINKGTNQPNKFLDPKSSESALPHYSSGHRDDFMQTQYLRAIREFWADPANNPTNEVTGKKMIDMSRAHVWAWDARPFPWFPKKRAIWGDWGNYNKGHWLNGRGSARSLASVVEEICARSGVTDVDTSELFGLVRGYVIEDVTDARRALQPLMLAYGFDAAERNGVLKFFTRDGRADGVLDVDRLAVSDEIDGQIEFSRAPEAEMVGNVRLSFVEAEARYDIRSSEAQFPDDTSRSVSASELPLVLTQSEGQIVTERWLAEARVSRDRARFALPPSDLTWGAGDVVEIETEEGAGLYRIDHVEQAEVQLAEAVRVEPGIMQPAEGVESEIDLGDPVHAVPVLPLWLDLPLLTGEEVAHHPRLAVTSDPWPGSVAVYSAAADYGYSLNALVAGAARVGVTESVLPSARPGMLDKGPALRVRMITGTLSSVGEDGMLNGGNVAAVGLGGPDNWEVIQFAEADLVEPGVYDLRVRLRGQAGSDWAMMNEWPAGAFFVVLDDAVTSISLPLSSRGLERHYRTGPSTEPLDDATFLHEVVTTHGVGLRPYAPAHVSAEATGGDLVVSWVRRTRIDGDSWQSTEVPLGEEREEYIVRVRDNGSVVREVSAQSPSWTYSAAQQAADGVGASYQIEVAQVSQAFGPGPVTQIDLGI